MGTDDIEMETETLGLLAQEVHLLNNIMAIAVTIIAPGSNYVFDTALMQYREFYKVRTEMERRRSQQSPQEKQVDTKDRQPRDVQDIPVAAILNIPRVLDAYARALQDTCVADNRHSEMVNFLHQMLVAHLVGK